MSGVMPVSKMPVAVGRQPLDDAQPDGRAVRQREDVEHRAGAEGPLADDPRPVVVLERGRHDLRGAGAAVVHEHHQRQVRRDRRRRAVRSRVRVPARSCSGTPRSSSRNMLAMATASSTRPPGLPRRSSTRPVAPCSRASSSASPDAVGGAVRELDQPDVGDPGPGHERPGHRRAPRSRARTMGTSLGGAVAMPDAQRDGRARLPADERDDLVHGQPLGAAGRRRW